MFGIRDTAGNGGLNGKVLSDNILSFNQKPPILTIPLVDLSIYEWVRNLSHETFEYLLSIYENNQDYYMYHNMVGDLIKMETWFIKIIEPHPTVERYMSRCEVAEIKEEWLTREMTKVTGRSYYSRANNKKVIVDRCVLKDVTAHCEYIAVCYK